MCSWKFCELSFLIYLYILYVRMSSLVPFTQPPGLMYIRDGHEKERNLVIFSISLSLLSYSHSFADCTSPREHNLISDLNINPPYLPEKLAITPIKFCLESLATLSNITLSSFSHALSIRLSISLFSWLFNILRSLIKSSQ